MENQVTAPAEIKETNALTTEPTVRPNAISDKVIKGRERARLKAEGKPVSPIVNDDPNKPLSPSNDGALTTEKIAELANKQPEAKTEEVKKETETKVIEPKAEDKPAEGETKKFWERKRVIPESAKEAAKPVPIPLEVEEELNKLRSIVNKTSVKQLLKIEQDGKDVESYYMERAQKDPSKLTPEQVMKGFLEEEGKTGEELDRLMENFSERDEIDKISLTSERKKSLIKEFKSKEKDSLKDFNPADPTEAINYRKAQVEFVNEVDLFVDSLKGQVHPEFGIRVDDKMVSSLKESFKTGVTIRENGTPDPQEFANREFLWNNREQIFETIWQAAEAQAIEKKMEEDTVSGKKAAPTAAIQYQVDPNHQLSGKEQYEKRLKPTLQNAPGQKTE